MAEAEYRAPVGTHDVLPPESARWTALVTRFAERAARYGYGLLITPVMEHVEVFQRVGAATDVIRKEMYELTDRGDRRLALRPEGTAPLEHSGGHHGGWPLSIVAALQTVPRRFWPTPCLRSPMKRAIATAALSVALVAALAACTPSATAVPSETPILVPSVAPSVAPSAAPSAS